MSVTAAAGFVASGVHAGIRKDKLDLAVVRSTLPATGAAMWTQNRVLAAPVDRLEAASFDRGAAGDRDQLRRRERCDRRAGRGRRARDRRDARRRCSTSRPSR